MSRRKTRRVKTAAFDRYLTKEQLRERLNLESTRAVDEMVKARKIPILRLGHRTVRFDWPKVEIALARLEETEIGRAA